VIFGESINTIIESLLSCYRFEIRCSVLKRGPLKGDCKNRGGISEIFECYFQRRI